MTTSNQYREFLSSLAFFQGFEPKEMDVLLGVLRLQRLDPDQYLFKQGMKGNACYILAQGSIRVTLGAPPNEEELAVLPVGALFGQVALIDGGGRSANCIAAEPSVVMALDRNEFDLLFRSGSTFAFKFLDVLTRILVGQLRNANTRLGEVAKVQGAKALPQLNSEPAMQEFFKDVMTKTDSFKQGDFDLGDVQVVYSESDRARGTTG